VTDPNTCGADTNPHSNAGWFNMTKMVELALYNGVDKLGGGQAGPNSGDAGQFKNMEDFFEAVKKQLEYAVYVNCIYNNVLDWTFANWHPLDILFTCVRWTFDVSIAMSGSNRHFKQSPPAFRVGSKCKSPRLINLTR